VAVEIGANAFEGPHLIAAEPVEEERLPAQPLAALGERTEHGLDEGAVRL